MIVVLSTWEVVIKPDVWLRDPLPDDNPHIRHYETRAQHFELRGVIEGDLREEARVLGTERIRVTIEAVRDEPEDEPEAASRQ